MKKIFLPVAMSALFLVGSLSMISMAPPPPPSAGCAAFAKEFADELEAAGMSIGNYVSACNVCTNKSESGGNIGVCECKSYILFGGSFDDLTEEYGITNFGSCVNYVKNL